MEWLKQFARLFGWKNRQYETLTEIKVGPWKVRVWRSERDLFAASVASQSDIHQAAMSIVSGPDGPSIKQIVEAVRDLPRVACVAVVDEFGNGVSAYPDWH